MLLMVWRGQLFVMWIHVDNVDKNGNKSKSYFSAVGEINSGIPFEIIFVLFFEFIYWYVSTYRASFSNTAFHCIIYVVVSNLLF